MIIGSEDYCFGFIALNSGSHSKEIVLTFNYITVIIFSGYSIKCNILIFTF